MAPSKLDVLNLPDEFDLEFYRRYHEDLRDFTDNELFMHHSLFGQKEGRATSAGSVRSSFIGLIPKDTAVLEIGPFCNPAVTGSRVKYFDVLNSKELKRKAQGHKLDLTRCPEKIHYVSPTGDLSVVGDKFDVVFSSHCIEHQPNLVKHIRDVDRILADSAYYFLIIPDKRYCFDYFIEESSIADIIDAHIRGRVLHEPRSVIEHQLLRTHNDSLRHWKGDHGIRRIDEDAGLLLSATAEAERCADVYIDTHAWQFTPESFRRNFELLFATGLSPLKPHRVYQTPYGSNEFCAVLGRPRPRMEV
ncbi:hypothetical protein [Fulvimarina sp. MAC3]|uniref:hypothetical protein n=1 Tax=Fulvimarina sp. MAC3 TaxID=3148887 RepID=UPI0031FE30C8